MKFFKNRKRWKLQKEHNRLLKEWTKIQQGEIDEINRQLEIHKEALGLVIEIFKLETPKSKRGRPKKVKRGRPKGSKNK